MAPLPPTAVRGDTFWWEDQPEHARPMGIGQELLQFASVKFLLFNAVSQAVTTWLMKKGFSVCIVASCGVLPNPHFGKVVLAETAVGFAATYSCQRGYILVALGGSIRMCQA